VSIRICLSGATGHVGRELIGGILKNPDMELAACLGFSSAGRRLDSVLRMDCPGLPIHASVAQALEAGEIDVLIDYTTPDAVYRTVTEGISNGLHCVIGTSGLTNGEYTRIHELANNKRVGVFAAGNFSLTAALMMHFAQLAAQFVPHWELFDFAPDTKIDAPSGTTRELAYLLGQIGRPVSQVPPENVHGRPDSRGAKINGSQVHSIRVPGYYSSSEAVFGLPGERLSIRHDSISYAPYVEGTLLAVQRVSAMQGLVRGMGKLLGFEAEASK